MKSLLLFALFMLFASPAFSATLSDKERCYEQSRKYVDDANRKDHRSLEWMGAHYENGTCYVRLGSMTTGSNGSLSVTEFVEDAFEGHNFATYIGNLGPTQAVLCDVQGVHCKTYDEYLKGVKKLMGES